MAALKVTTTHIKYSFVHRNGIPLSPYAVMTEYYWRHGDLLTLAIIVEDPIYLTEPLVRTATFKRDPNLTIPAPQPFEVAEELPSLEKGQVPAYPLGTKHPEYADAAQPAVRSVAGRRADDVPGIHEAARGVDEDAPRPRRPARDNDAPAAHDCSGARAATPGSTGRSPRSESSSGQAGLRRRQCRSVPVRATSTSSPDPARTSPCRSIPDGAARRGLERWRR